MASAILLAGVSATDDGSAAVIGNPQRLGLGLEAAPREAYSLGLSFQNVTVTMPGTSADQEYLFVSPISRMVQSILRGEEVLLPDVTLLTPRARPLVAIWEWLELAH